MKKIILETFTEVINGVPKGSGKAVCAFCTMLTIMFTIGWDTIKDKPTDIGLILVLVGFINGLYAVKGWTAIQTYKSQTKTIATDSQIKN